MDTSYRRQVFVASDGDVLRRYIMDVASIKPDITPHEIMWLIEGGQQVPPKHLIDHPELLRHFREAPTLPIQAIEENWSRAEIDDWRAARVKETA